MKISVVIPLYNKERHISRAIYSVLNQSISDFELIVVNDGSDDDSLNVVERINDHRIRIISQKNMGVSSARNTGIQNSRSDIIAFLDADDEWKPHFLQDILKLKDSYPNAGIYSTAYEKVNSNGSKETAIYSGKYQDDFEGIIDDYFLDALKNDFICSSAVAIPKNILEETGKFTVGMVSGEDREMWIRILLKYQLAFSSKIAAIYYKDSDNMATKNRINYSNSFISLSDVFYEENKNLVKPVVNFREFMTRDFITKSRYLIEEGDKKKARSILNKYKDSKFFKKKLILLYLASFLPRKIFSFLFKLKFIFKLI